MVFNYQIIGKSKSDSKIFTSMIHCKDDFYLFIKSLTVTG